MLTLLLFTRPNVTVKRLLEDLEQVTLQDWHRYCTLRILDDERSRLIEEGSRSAPLSRLSHTCLVSGSKNRKTRGFVVVL